MVLFIVQTLRKIPVMPVVQFFVSRLHYTILASLLFYLRLIKIEYLAEWLLNLEYSGTKLFVDSISKYRAKLIDSISKADREQPLYEQERKKLDSDLFYIDNKGEEKDGGADDDEIMKDTSGSEFVTTARTMIVTENDGKIKRKKRKIVQKMKNVKYVKYKIRGDAALMEKDSNVADDDLDSEVENSGFDEETEAG